MPIEIINNGASLKIKSGTSVRNITKIHIKEVVVIKNNIIKLDIGKDALGNVFIPHPEVINPVLADPESLKEAINAMLCFSGGGVSTTSGGATEAKQIEQLNKLTTINDSVTSIKNALSNIDNKLFFEPLLVDDSNPNVIYKGYANPASNQNDSVWAIQRIVISGEVNTIQWADGNKNFDNNWKLRQTLMYV